MPSTAIAETLRLTNCRVGELLTRIFSRQGHAGEGQDFENLLSELSRTAGLLRGISHDSIVDAELAQEVSTYRSSLEQLQQTLPAAHERLLGEKARIEAARSHVASVAAWTESRKQLL